MPACTPCACLPAHHVQEMAPRYGSLVDIHGHFLAGERSWLTAVIEPSLEGASEVRVGELCVMTAVTACGWLVMHVQWPTRHK